MSDDGVEATLAAGFYESADAETLFGVAMRRHPEYGLFAPTSYVEAMSLAAAPEEIGRRARLLLSEVPAVQLDFDNGRALDEAMGVERPNDLFKFRYLLMTLETQSHRIIPSERHPRQGQSFLATEDNVLVPVGASDSELGRGLLDALEACR